MFRFPWGDMHSLNLGWFLQKFNELREDWATAEAGIDGALDAEIQKAEDALSDVFDARDAAAASATAASGSASAANTSKVSAQNSATAAASSATLANQKASAAGLSEAAAAQSASAASNSATAAATSATQAGNSAANAANSATAAAGSATAAAGSATAAGNSATAAAASAAAAEAVEESIPEDYITLSNTVNALKNNVENDVFDADAVLFHKNGFANTIVDTGRRVFKIHYNILKIDLVGSAGATPIAINLIGTAASSRAATNSKSFSLLATDIVEKTQLQVSGMSILTEKEGYSNSHRLSIVTCNSDLSNPIFYSDAVTGNVNIAPLNEALSDENTHISIYWYSHNAALSGYAAFKFVPDITQALALALSN